MMAGITRQIIGFVLLAAAMSAAAAVATAQESVKGADQAIATYQVAHDHAIGEGRGELRLTEAGIAFKGEGKDEERHSRNWRDDDIKRLEISRDELRLVVYEAARITIIPRKVPWSGGGKGVRTGSEHDYVFRLRSGEVTPEVVSALLARFKRPVATSVIPPGDEESGHPLFEIPVFHRHRAGGESGVLRVYEDRAVFDADAKSRSRYWRYPDIRDIGNLGRYQFEIATYEGQFGADGKSYIFDLKRPMTEAEYESFWKKVYERGRQTGLRPAANHKQE
jgi:hypothetical protein